MKKFIFLALLLFPVLAAAQIPPGFVQTTATVPKLAEGTFGAAWTNLSSSPQLGLLGCVSTFQITVDGKFDAYGHFSTLLADTAQICPSPSTWTFTLTFACPAGFPPTAFTVQVPITGGGGTEDISSQITAVLPPDPCAGGGSSGPVISTTVPIEVNGGTGPVSTGSALLSCNLATNSTVGCLRPDGSTCTVTAGVLTCSPGAGTITDFEHNDTLLTGLFAPNSGIQKFDVSDTLPAAPTGNQNVTFQTDTATGRVSAYIPSSFPPALEMQIPLPTPPAQQYVLYATNCTQTNAGNNNGTIVTVPGFCGNSSGLTAMPPNAGGIFWGSGALTWGGYTLPSFISQGNITAVYGVMTSSLLGGPGATVSYTVQCTDGVNTISFLNPSTPYTSMTNVVQFGSVPTIANMSCQYSATRGLGSLTTAWINVPLIGLIIDYTGSAPPVDNNLKVAPPLYYNASTNTLGLTPLSSITPTTVAQLPTTGTDTWPLGPGQIQLVSDGSTTSGTCTAGGTDLEWCQWTGSAWTVFSSGGGSGPAIQIGGTPTSDQTTLNFISPASFNGLSFAWSNPSGGNVTFGLSGTLNSAGLTSTTVTPGSYTNANITVNAAGQLTAASNGSGGGSGCTVSGPANSIQIANSGVTNCTSDPNILIDTTAHAIDIGGTIPTNHFNLTNLGTITAPWTLDVTSPSTAIASIFSLTTTGSGSPTFTGTVLNIPPVSTVGTLPTWIIASLAGPQTVASQFINLIPVATSTVFASSCAGSYAGATVAATGSTTFTLTKHAGGPTGSPTVFCTATWSASGVSATITGTGGTAAAGDYLEIDGPVTPDGTLANIGMDFYGLH